MVRTATSKYGFWLAGYYEDFLGSRVITDDSNAPSSHSNYDANLTHHGNTMNGEATLNPRYRWSVRDRQATEFADSTNYLLTNDGIHRWATFDHIRLGKGSTWVGRSQLQYPSTLAHPNRLRFLPTPHSTASVDATYMTICSSSDTNAKYYLPGGDTDASFGRDSHYAFNGKTYEAGEAGQVTGTQPNFMQYAHMTGVWMGERLQAGAYNGSDGSATTHENHPERIFTPIKSLAGKPFLCVTTYMADDTAHQLNNITPVGEYRPVIAYDQPLNSRTAGDYFTLRMATHAMKGMYTGSAPDDGIAGQIDTSAQVKYTVKIGFPSNTNFGTEGSIGGTAAIEWDFVPHSGAGLSAPYSYYHMLYDADEEGQNESESLMKTIWQDFDFKFIGSNKFKVYHNGTEVTATNTAAGAYSEGYTLKNNTQTSAAFNQDEMTGWELFVVPETSAYNKCLIDTMIDRVALYRPLTDIPDGTSLPAPVDNWNCRMPANGISTASITVLDDDTEQNLTPWFTNDNISDWKLLMFNDNIHRPLWSGIIEKINIKQEADKRTREIGISARDSLSLLSKQIMSWEVGQIGLGESDEVLARRSEVSDLSDAMFFGAAKLRSNLPTIGFEKTGAYTELHHQRMSLNTAHPIQMYNNEDVRGPNNIENEWLGYKIKGFNNPTGTVCEAILEQPSTGFADGDTVSVVGSDNHNLATGTLASSAVSTAHNTLSAGYFSSDGITTTTVQAVILPGITYQKNTSATLEGYGSYDPRSTAAGGTAQFAGYVIYRFSAEPTRADGSTLKVGDYLTVAEKSQSSYINGTFRVMATITHGGKYYVQTNYIVPVAAAFSFVTRPMEFSIETGYLKPTDIGLEMRTAHAVWMRQLADSPWFKKHYGVYKSTPQDILLTDGSVLASDTQITFTGSFTGTSGVGQIVDSDGFVDTFTFTGGFDPHPVEGTKKLVGVSGLSKSHADDSTIYILNTKEDYKHLWLQWADMRNNGDADANGGYGRTNIGLMKPLAENYNVSISFTDQYEDDGSFTEFTDLKIGSDLDVWELDSKVDPSTGIPYSLPLGSGGAKAIRISSGNAVNGPILSGYQSGAYTGKIYIECADADAPSVGDKILLGGCGVYDKEHTVSFVDTSGSNSLIVLATDHTVDIAYSASNFAFFVVLQAENVEVDLRAWENTGGSVVVYDCSKFFNLNTFINGGSAYQTSGGRVNIGDYETEYHGFPVLMDNYWVQGSATTKNATSPFSHHENHRLWNGATIELNRTIEVGDTVIESKPSTSLIGEFEQYGYGKIKATRGANTNNPSSETFWYVYDGKLDSSIVETATSTTANASSMVITCSGADFVNEGVKPGMRVRNVTQKWVAQITAVTSTTVTVSNTTLANETGGTTQTVAINDTISIPEQLYGVYLEPDTGRNFTAEQAETYLQATSMNGVLKSQGVILEIAVNADSQQNATGAYDQVILVASVSPRYALRFLMKVGGFVSSPNIGTYWFSDKMRFMWSFLLSNTWLAQAAVPCWYDIGSVPLTNNMTTDSNNANYDSFGSVADMRGGKSIFSVIKQSNESTGFGYENGLRLPMTYQIGRDNKIEVRPTYESGEVINRDILSVSGMDAEMGSQISNVRVYYNNGISFADYPTPTLNQRYRWKIVELPEVGTDVEALAIAKEEYFKSKKKSISISGDILKDTTFDDKMLDKGRYAYIADPYRHTERGVAGNTIFNTSNNAVHSPSVDRNGVWCAVNGIMFCGTQNALDGQMSKNGSDRYRRDRYGAGITAQGTSASQTVTYDNNFYWWGANSVSHAVQPVHIPTKTPLLSNTYGKDLRIWIALKDGQTGTDIDNAEFTIGLTDMQFNTNPQAAFDTDYTQGGSPIQSSFGPTLAVSNKSTTTVNVKRNGFYEIAIPSTYWTAQSGTERVILSVNVDYLKDILRHRCGDPTSSSILHNAHNINTETGVSNWSATNTNSLFPLGLRQYANMTGAFSVRNAWYCPRLHIVPDLRWRPATTVEFTDSGLGLSAEPLTITDISWGATGSSIEKIELSLERDQTKEAGGLASFLYPTVSRGRGSSHVGGGGSGGNTPPTPKPDTPPATGGGTGGGTDTPYIAPTSGPVGSTAFTPSQIEGGRMTQVGGGAFSNSVSGNMLASGIHARVSGRMDLLENGVSDASFGLLGQARSAPPSNTQRSVEGIGDTLFAGSSTSTVSSEGMVFSGISDPDSSDRQTQTHSVSVRVPDDVSDEIVTIDCSYSLGGTSAGRANLTVVANCEETGSSITRTVTFGGDEEKQSMPLLSGNLNGAETGGNNITITVTRVPGSGDDDLSYSALVLHNIRVNFQRFSLKGMSTSAQGFNPY